MVSGNESDLSRDLGFLAVFTTATGTMIGAGIFVLPQPAAESAGPSAVLAFAIAGIIAFVATMCAVELATAMPRAGGSYYFVSRAMGPLVGTVVGLGAWLSLILKGSFALVGLGWYVTEFLALPDLAVAAVAGVLLTLLNWVGAEESGQLQNLVVVGLVAVIALFVGSGTFEIATDNLDPFLAEGPRGLVETTGLVFISYLGIVKATALAEEVEDPGRTLPRALFAAVIFVTLLYVAVMLVIVGVMPIDEIVASEGDALVAEAGKLFLGTVGGVLIVVAGVFATLSTANAAVLSSSRFPFAMARDGLAMPSLRRSSPRFGTPTHSVWITGGVMVALALLLPVEDLAKLGGTFGILVFALLNVTVVLLRSAQPEWYDPDYRIPFSPVLPLAGTTAALLLIPLLGLLSQVAAVAFVLLGIGWYYYQKRIGESVEPDHDVTDQVLGVQYKKSIDEKEDRMGELGLERPHIIVETVEGETSPHLETVMEAFGEQYDADIEVVTISEVPSHIPLAEFDHDIDDDWQETIREDVDISDHQVTFDHVRARDRTDALLELVNEQTELMLVDWLDPVRKHHLRESHVDEILRAEVPVRLAVLKHRDRRPIEEIVVATEIGPYDRAEVELADAIAAATGATLTLVKAIPEDASEEAKRSAEIYLDDLTGLLTSPAETKLIRTNDVTGTLVERGNRADLLVMGAPSKGDRFHEFFGQTTDIVAAESETSVLVVKEPGVLVPWHRRLWRRLTGR